MKQQTQWIKSQLDREQKEEVAAKRLVKEVKERCDEVNGKRAAKFEAEVSKWVSGVLGRIEVGSTLFYDYIKARHNSLVIDSGS